MDFRMNKMCRICLKEGDDFKSLFLKEDVQNLDVSLPQKILACSSVQVGIFSFCLFVESSIN